VEREAAGRREKSVDGGKHPISKGGEPLMPGQGRWEAESESEEYERHQTEI